jgi:nucleoside-diphosphate-sugar epimerase
MNFSVISENSFLSAALHYPIRWPSKDLVMPILQGPLRAKKWIVGSIIHVEVIEPHQPDISLARQKLGWEPKIPLREGIRHTIAHFDELLSVPR